jgi:outer membrane protein assembly complex protein YaeT
MAELSVQEGASRSRGRRVLRGLAIALAVIVAVVVLAAVAVQTPPARRFVERKVTQLLAQQDITFENEGFRYNVFGLGGDLRNVRVFSPRLKDAPPFLELDRARFDLSTWQLMRGRYVLEAGTVDGVRLHYFVNDDGVDNLPRKPADPDNPGRPINYLIADLRVPNASIRYENRQRDIDITLPSASLTMNGNALTDRHEVTIEASGGTVRLQQRSAAIDRIATALDLGRDDVRIERAEIAAEGAQLNASGSFGPFEQPIADLAFQATFDAARAARVAKIADSIAGQVSAEGTVKGALDALEIDGRITGNGIAYRELTGLTIDTAATYQMGAGHLRIARLDVRGPAGTISGEGELALGGSGQSHLNATVERLNAESLMRSIGLDYRVASHVDGRVNAKWIGTNYAAAAGDAQLSLTPARTSAVASTLPIGGRIDVTGSGERAVATLRNLRAAGAELNGRVTIDNRRAIDGAVQARAANVQTTIAAIESFLGRRRGSLAPMPIAGALAADGRISGTLSAPVVTASVDAPSLNVGDAAAINVNGDLAYRRDAVAINRLDVLWQGARASARGVVGLQGARRLDLDVRADAVQIDGLLQALERADVPASGVVSATAQIGGTVAQPSGNVRLVGDNLVAYNETWGSLVADARVAGRRIEVTSLQVDKPQPDGNGRIVATGSYELDARRYGIDLRSENVRLLSLVLPGGRRVTGAFDLTARGAGTVSDPAGQINLRAGDLVVGEYAIGDLIADTTLANRVASTVARSEQFALTAKSDVRVDPPYQATIVADVDNLDLATLPVKLETPLEGRIRAHVEATGPLADPQQGTAQATVDTFEGSWRQMPFRIDGPAGLRYADERLTIDRLRVLAQDSTIEVSGNLPLLDRSAPGTININADANLATLIQYAPVGTDLAADGRLTLTGSLQGTLKAIDPNLKLAVADALILSPRIEPGLSNLTATATIADGEAAIDRLTATWGTAQIDLSARVPLDLLPQLPVEIPRRGGAAVIKARLDGLDPSTIPGAPAGLSGRISLDADIAARRPDIREAEGTIAFRDLQLGFNGLTLEQKGPSTIAVANGVMTVQRFELGGSVGTLAASGTVGLTETRPLNLDVDGNLNIAAISIVTDRVRAEGDSTIDIVARGTLADPLLSGNVEIRDGAVVIDEPRIAAEALHARLDLDGNRLNLAALSANLNGGTLAGSGSLAIEAGGVVDVDVEIETRDFAFDAPLDLRSLSDSDITIRSQDGDIVVGGQVTIQEAGLTGDINFDTGLLATITTRPTLELTPQRNPLLERVLFNVDVDTAAPILVDNNLAKAEVTTDVRVVGTPYETGLLGRLEVAEGGLVTLNERTFEIERGQVTFIEDRRIYPSFDLLMNTTASSYDITLGVSGEPGNTETTLTSNPPLPEPDIMAMIVTGRTLDQMRGEEYDVAREQVLSYLTGRVGSTIGRSVERATGFDVVRIEPQLIANEADPGARLTVSEDIDDNLTLTYSVDLADSDDQIWLATYDVTRRFQTRAVRQQDNSFRFDFRHDIRRGGRPEPRRIPRVRPEVIAIAMPEDAPLPAQQLRNLLGVSEGDDFDYFAVRNGVEDIETRLREAGWAQSRVRLDRQIDAGGVKLGLRIIRGPQVEFVYAGATPPRRVQEEVRVQWHRGVFDAQRTDDAAETLVEWLMRDDYLQGKVTARVDESTPERRRVRFDITPGPRSARVLLEFQGASGIPADELDEVISEQKLERQLFTDPTVVTELLQRLYREQGYLNAEIEAPRYEFEGAVARVIVEVREGPQFTVNDVTFSGLAALNESDLTGALPVVPGDPFMPAAAENALQHIRNQYWARGYNDVRAAYQLTLDRIGGRAGVAFTVDEGRQSIVTEVRIAGNDKTSERLVREQITVAPAEPLNLQALSRSRKNLYDSGAFSVVDLSRDTVVEAMPTGNEDANVIGALTGAAAPTKPVIVDVAVREVQPFQFRYGASYDTEGKLGGVFDASLHNFFGKARVAGIASRYDAQVREGRVYMSQPTLRHWPIQTTASVYYREERNPETTISDAFNVDRRGASIQQERRLKNDYVWTYGYRFERARSYDPLGVDPEEFTKVSPLTSAFVRETRDEILDATRGSFSSHAFSFSPQWLGSDDTYLKYFGQYFHYFPLQPERRRRFSNEIIRPRLVFATGVRLGVSKGMGVFVPTSERFYAGGSTTIRGFEQNALGPISVNGKPIGGDAMLILNNEVRFPLVSIVDGVGFLDAGNVFQRTRDFSFTDLRKTAGVGVRLRTKWVLVRGDYGFVLDRREGEPRGRFYFSIGQAF